jgi:hypothetical protein
MPCPALTDLIAFTYPLHAFNVILITYKKKYIDLREVSSCQECCVIRFENIPESIIKARIREAFSMLINYFLIFRVSNS